MTYILWCAFAVTLYVVVRAKTYWLFPVYLVAELVKMLVYTPGTGWYVWMESPVLALRCMAAIEAWYLLTWWMGWGERRLLRLVGVGVGLLAVALTLTVWPLDAALGGFNQARLAAHVWVVGLLGSAALWLTLHPVRGASVWHAWILTAYIVVFAAVGAMGKPPEGSWYSIRGIFRAGLLPCLAAWILHQLFQKHNLTLKSLYAALLQVGFHQKR